MKPFVSADMEGLPHIVSEEQMDPGKYLYDEARNIMTDCVLSVVDELFKAPSVKNIVVADGHSQMINIIPSRLPKSVLLVRGQRYMLAGADGCDFAIYIGYHARPQTAHASFDHTETERIQRMTINGIEMSEFLLNSAFLGEIKIPVGMCAGDKALLDDDVSKYAPWVIQVPLKTSLGRYSAISPSMPDIDRMLRDGTKKAVHAFQNGKLKLFKLKSPLKVSIQFQTSAMADVAAHLPGSKRVGSEIRFVCPNMKEVIDTMDILLGWTG
jgi:D-amino peptidase